MKFLPVVDLWNHAIQSAVVSGQLKLQVGQWVRCGSDSLSRFVRVTESGSLYVVHPTEGGRIKRVDFSHKVDIWLGKNISRKTAGN